MADRSVVYEFKGKFTNLTAGLAATGKQVGALGSELTALDKNGAKARQGLTALGGTAGKIGLVAAAGLGAAALSAANFDQQMSNVAATGQEARDSMDALRQAAIQAGADTAFSAGEAAQGMEALLKAGVSVSDVLGGGLTGALDLAAAGELAVGDAAELAATAMTQFKLGGEDVSHVADLLAAGAGKAQGDVSDLGAALKQSGLIAAQTGLSIEETVGTLSAFASAGLIGSDAGTSFKTMLQSLTPNSEKAASAMEAMGFSAYDAQGNFKGMTTVAADLREGLSTMTVEQQNATLKTIFGSDAVRAAAVIYEQGADGIQSWIDKTNDAGYAAETAATRLDNLKGDFEALTGSLETLLITGGEGSQGFLRTATQNATSFVNVLNNLPDPAKNAASSLLAITAVTGGGLWFGAKVVGSIADTRAALADLTAGSGKAATAMRGLVKATVALAALEAAGAVINSISDAAVGAAPGVDRLTSALISASDTKFIDEFGGELGDAIDMLDLGKVDSLANSLNNLGEKGGGVGTALVGGFGTIIGLGGPMARTKVEVEQVAQAFASLDAALASLVVQAGPERAAEAFDKLVASQNLSADQTAQLIAQLPEYDAALASNANSVALNATTAEDFAAQVRANAAANNAAKSATIKYSEALIESRKAASATAGEFVNLGNKLDNAKVSLGGWLRDLEKQAAALRDFRQNAQAAADKGLRGGLIAALNEAGPAGALRMKQLANATESEISRANKAWGAGQREVGKYTDAIGGVPRNVKTDVDVDTGAARSEIDGVKNALNSLPLTRTVHINVTADRVRNPADFATGGYTGHGGKYEAAGIVHRGEVVLPQEIVKRDRAHLQSRYANLPGMGNLPGYATGGLVSGRGGGNAPDISPNLKRLADSADHASASSKRELVQRQKMLTAEAQEHKTRMSALKQERDSILASVAARQSDIFARTEATTTEVPLPDLTGMDAEQRANALDAWQIRADFFAKADDRRNASSAGNPTSALKDDIGELRNLSTLISQLKGKGLDGAALSALIEGGDMDQIAAYANGTRKQAQRYERLYDRRERLTAQVGQEAAAAQGVVRELRESRKDVKETNAQLKAVESRLAAIEKQGKTAPADTGKAVGKELNNAQTAGRRGR